MQNPKSPERSEHAIVVVDDTYEIHLLYTIMLTKFFPEAKLYFAQDGKIGIEKVEEAVSKHSKVVVLSDVEMPRVSGTELVRTLRTSGNEAIANVPIILNTANTGIAAELEQKLSEQTDGHHFDLLLKPVLGSVLQQAVLKALGE